MIAGEIAERLFPDLPAKDRHALGDILDRDLIGEGRGWLRPLVTGGHLTHLTAQALPGGTTGAPLPDCGTF
jgi:hypothetical protein